ncbi:hypothetical protein QYF50_18770 [Paenibacillus vini]|uniref:hypothetical protein n=1 Tax=Paenibacillus vini TaxID=1476024 RepID=UPI0025B65208|nr:hypothetical protein [Paenibacillus vini]MDN4069949.1 hypothetical protein [Paenibacillus vini]
MDKKELFLEELSNLSKKFSMYIGGCGCCDSPFITDEDNNDILGNMYWDSEKQGYNVLE